MPLTSTLGWKFNLALHDVARERKSQIEKWGEQEDMSGLWRLSVLTEEVGEVARALNDCESNEALRAELIQVAAVSLAWVESLDP